VVKLPKIHLKMLRDLKAAKFQFGAVVLVIMIGISLYIGSYSAYLNLNNSYEHSFDLLNMGDYWITLDEVSSRAVTELDSIPGVTAQGRIVGTVQIDLGQDTGARIEGRVISLPEREHPLVNNIMINSGSYFSRSPGREILLEKHFADWHKLRPGDSLMLEREGIRGMFTIAGVISSPEYI
jgi:putative ABC transport system permease protein